MRRDLVAVILLVSVASGFPQVSYHLPRQVNGFEGLSRYQQQQQRDVLPEGPDPNPYRVQQQFLVNQLGGAQVGVDAAGINLPVQQQQQVGQIAYGVDQLQHQHVVQQPHPVTEQPHEVPETRFAYQSHGGDYQKHYYLFSAPEDNEEIPIRIIPAPPTQPHYKVIFIKAPQPPRIVVPRISVQPQTPDKTLVYVLVKKPEDLDDIQLPQSPPPNPVKPDVFFIKYRTDKAQYQVADVEAERYKKRTVERKIARVK